MNKRDEARLISAADLLVEINSQFYEGQSVWLLSIEGDLRALSQSVKVLEKAQKRIERQPQIEIPGLADKDIHDLAEVQRKAYSQGLAATVEDLAKSDWFRRTDMTWERACHDFTGSRDLCDRCGQPRDYHSVDTPQANATALVELASAMSEITWEAACHDFFGGMDLCDRCGYSRNSHPASADIPPSEAERKEPQL